MVELRVIIIIELVVVEVILVGLEELLFRDLIVGFLLEVLTLVGHGLDLPDELGHLLHRNQLLIEEMRMLLVQLLGGFQRIRVEYQLLQQNRVDAFFGIRVLLLVDHADDWWFVSHAQLYVEHPLLIGLKLGTRPSLPDMLI